MKFLIKLLVVFFLFFQEKSFAKENCCSSQILKEISQINRVFFHSKSREFLQISSNNNLIRKKKGIFECEFRKFIRITYDKPKSEIFYDNSDFIVHTNKMLKSVKKYKNQNQLFPLILNSDFYEIFNQKSRKAKCLQTYFDSKKDLILFEAIVHGSLEGENSKSQKIQFILNRRAKSVSEINLIFSEKDYVKLIFKN